MKQISLEEALKYVPNHVKLRQDDYVLSGDDIYLVSEKGDVILRGVPDEVRVGIAKTIQFISGLKDPSAPCSPDLYYARWLYLNARKP